MRSLEAIGVCCALAWCGGCDDCESIGPTRYEYVVYLPRRSGPPEPTTVDFKLVFEDGSELHFAGDCPRRSWPRVADEEDLRTEIEGTDGALAECSDGDYVLSVWAEASNKARVVGHVQVGTKRFDFDERPPLLTMFAKDTKRCSPARMLGEVQAYRGFTWDEDE